MCSHKQKLIYTEPGAFGFGRAGQHPLQAFPPTEVQKGSNHNIAHEIHTTKFSDSLAQSGPCNHPRSKVPENYLQCKACKRKTIQRSGKFIQDSQEFRYVNFCPSLFLCPFPYKHKVARRWLLELFSGAGYFGTISACIPPKMKLSPRSVTNSIIYAETNSQDTCSGPYRFCGRWCLRILRVVT